MKLLTILCFIALAPFYIDCAGDGGNGADPSGSEPCIALFGMPSETTGLDESQCKASCDCEGIRFEAPKYTDEQIAALATRDLLDPPAALTSDPYREPDRYPEQPEKACALMVDSTEPNAYRLRTFANPTAAEDEGATVTHHGACGLCSSLKNLAVYIRFPDLTEPVRDCGIQGITGGAEANIACLQDLGFDLPCAQIWYYNTQSTRENCLDLCMAALDEPYHLEDGSPNACIRCDEEHSGPVFKGASGRTRRNSGLPTALCRPCSTIAPIVHDYP